jgi:hypothetical protein
VYDIGYRHAIANIRRHGGRVEGSNIYINTQQPKPVKFEKSYPNMYPVQKADLVLKDGKELSFEFEGTGFVVNGEPRAKNNKNTTPYEFQAEVYLDGQKIESPRLPTDFTVRRLELSWKYPLPKGKHTVQIKILNPDDRYDFRNLHFIIFSDKPIHDPLTP